MRIGDNGAIIPSETDGNSCKVVCYDMVNGNPHISAVYQLENYDYNIHQDEENIAEVIVNLETKGIGYDTARKTLQSIELCYNTLFRKYNKQSGRFINATQLFEEHGFAFGDNLQETERNGISELNKRYLEAYRNNDKSLMREIALEYVVFTGDNGIPIDAAYDADGNIIPFDKRLGYSAQEMYTDTDIYNGKIPDVKLSRKEDWRTYHFLEKNEDLVNISDMVGRVVNIINKNDDLHSVIGDVESQRVMLEEYAEKMARHLRKTYSSNYNKRLLMDRQSVA